MFPRRIACDRPIFCVSLLDIRQKSRPNIDLMRINIFIHNDNRMFPRSDDTEWRTSIFLFTTQILIRNMNIPIHMTTSTSQLVITTTTWRCTFSTAFRWRKSEIQWFQMSFFNRSWLYWKKSLICSFGFTSYVSFTTTWWKGIFFQINEIIFYSMFKFIRSKISQMLRQWMGFDENTTIRRSCSNNSNLTFNLLSRKSYDYISQIYGIRVILWYMSSFCFDRMSWDIRYHWHYVELTTDFKYLHQCLIPLFHHVCKNYVKTSLSIPRWIWKSKLLSHYLIRKCDELDVISRDNYMMGNLSIFEWNYLS